MFVNFRAIIAYFEVAAMSLDKPGFWKSRTELTFSIQHQLASITEDTQDVMSPLPPSCLRSENSMFEVQVVTIQRKTTARGREIWRW